MAHAQPLAERSVGDWSGVLDARAARTNQFFASLAIGLAIALDAPAILVAWASVVLLGVALGPVCIPAYRLYFAVIRPIVGDGRFEDARAPRFAQVMGAAGMLVAALLVFVGAAWPGWVLAGAIAVAALYSVFFDFCVGCWTYRLTATFRGVRARTAGRIEPGDVGLSALAPGTRAVVEFFHPMCHECMEWKRRLDGDPRPTAFVDVGARPDLAEKYGVAFVPAVLEIDHQGRVLSRLSR